MREVNLRQFRQNLTKELESDCCIISRGEVVGYFVKQLPDVKQLNVKQPDNVEQCIDAGAFVSRYNDIPLNLSKEAQAKGHMSH